jgi:hypothetical protein
MPSLTPSMQRRARRISFMHSPTSKGHQKPSSKPALAMRPESGPNARPSYKQSQISLRNLLATGLVLAVLMEVQVVAEGAGKVWLTYRAASYRAACLVKVTEGGMRAREWVRRGFRGLHSSRAPDLEGPVRSGCPLLPPVQWIGCSEAIRKSSNMDTIGYHFRRPHRHPYRRPRHQSTLLMMMNLALLQAQPSITTRSRSRYNCRPCDRAVSAAFRFTSLSDCYNKCELAAA